MYMTVLFTITQIHFDLKKKIIEVLRVILSLLCTKIFLIHCFQNFFLTVYNQSIRAII